MIPIRYQQMQRAQHANRSNVSDGRLSDIRTLRTTEVFRSDWDDDGARHGVTWVTNRGFAGFGCFWLLISTPLRRFLPALASCGRNSPLVPDETGEVVGEIGHADLGPGTCNADRAHEQVHAGFLLREDMLHEGTDL